MDRIVCDDALSVPEVNLFVELPEARSFAQNYFAAILGRRYFNAAFIHYVLFSRYLRR